MHVHTIISGHHMPENNIRCQLLAVVTCQRGSIPLPHHSFHRVRRYMLQIRYASLNCQL